MSKAHDFERDEIFPSYFVDALQEIVSAGRLDFRLSLKSSTTIQVVPDSVFGLAGLNIEGRYRWNTVTVERIHPGGAKGTYVIWATAADDDIVDVPLPKTDETVRSFDLAITSGAEPGGVDIAVKVGELDWSGAEIEALRQTYAPTTGAMLANDALPSNADSDVEWKRQPGGGYLLQLKADSVGANELADNAVFSAALQNLAVLTEKIANLAITEGKLAANAVTAAKLANLAVETAKLANEAVTEAKLGNLAVSTAKLANLAVTAAKIANEAVGTGQLANLAVTVAKLAANAVTEAKIADGAVTSRKTKLTVEELKASETLTLTEAFKDVPGASLVITPEVASIVKVTATFYMLMSDPGGGGIFGIGTVGVDGVDQSPTAVHVLNSGGSSGGTVSQVYKIPLTAAAHTIKLRAKREGIGTGSCVKENTHAVCELVAS